YSDHLNYATRIRPQMIADLIEGCHQIGCTFDYYIEPVATPPVASTPVPAPSTATPSPAPTAAAPLPANPTVPPRVPGYIIYAGGEGAATDSDFRFSIGKRDNGTLEGWLVWAPYADGHIANVTLSTMEGSGGTVSVWGKEQIQGLPWAFNLVASKQSAVI